MEEKTFFSAGDVIVTNARFIAHGQTYAMSGITSVKSFRQDPSRKVPIILGFLGLLVAASASGGGRFVGLLLIAGAVAVWVSQKPEYSVLLSSASGEVKPLASKDGGFISQVVAALNDSIVHRG